MRHFIFEDEDYEMNPEYKNPKKRHILTAGLAALYILSRHKGSGAGGTKKYIIDRRQNCTVKMHYSYSKSAHLDQIDRYLKREGVGKDGKDPVLFGDDEEEYKKNMDSKNFRIFLSPASNSIPLESLAKIFIDRLALQTGYDFRWVGAEHHNTAHAHAHILINGIDKYGKDIFLHRDIVKTYMRDIARDICTSMIGCRTNEQIRMEKEMQLKSSRFIRFDNSILLLINDRNEIHEKKIIRNTEQYKTRLTHLIKLGLCKWDNGIYKFERNWVETLKNVTKYNTYLEARNNLQFSSKYNFEVFNSSQGPKTGIVTHVYRMQEDSDSHAVILESIDGKAYYIPLFYKPKVKSGDLICVTPKPNQKGRLTPFFDRKNYSDIQKECFDNNYTEGFASVILNRHGAVKNRYTEHEK